MAVRCVHALVRLARCPQGITLLTHHTFSRHLLPIEEKSYHRRLPDMVWQFFWSMVVIQVSPHQLTVTHSNQSNDQILCYPLQFSSFWTPLLGFIVYLSSRLSPNESVSLFGLITLNVKWFPYVLVAFDMTAGARMGCGTISGLIVAQVLFMLEFKTQEGNTFAEPTLRRQSKFRAPDWLSRLLVKPEVQGTATVRTVYGNATAPAYRGLGDLGKGANVPGSSGYKWGKGHKLGGT